MTDKLLPCPFCGGEARQSGETFERTILQWVYCTSCGAAGGYRHTEAEAIAAWNTRTERTCCMEYNEKASGDELYPTEAYICSLCRCVTLDGKPNYCPNCGARVVE